MISLYIHIPICKRKCDYCSFYSVTSLNAEEYIDSIIHCVEFHSRSISNKVDTIYIGGGTPSVLPPQLICKLFEKIRLEFDIADGAEITVEANPESCTDGFLKACIASGVNRLSLGIQSLNEAELNAVGRIHTAREALSAVARARTFGFKNISADLIFGLPLQTEKSFSDTLNTFIGLDIEHISCYNLQVEKGTPLEKSAIEIPNEDEQEKMYRLACEKLQAAGFEHYEISNYAKPGFKSRHNGGYWTDKDYLGIGPAAHSRLSDMRYSYLPDVKRFMSKSTFEFDTAERIGDAFFENVMLSLRTDRGIATSLLHESSDFISRLCDERMATVSDGVLRLTDKGFYLSNSIITEICCLEEKYKNNR